MPEDLWDEDSEGNVILYPLVGAVVADFAETTILLRLEYKLRHEGGRDSKAALQLAMTPEEAIRFAKVVLAKAQHLFMQGPTERPN